MSFSIAWYWTVLSGIYLKAYSAVVIISFLFYFFIKTKSRNEVINCFYSFNTVVLWISTISIPLYAGELFVAWYGQNPYEYYVFTENKANLWHPYGLGFWVMLVCNFLLPQLFWFKKLRKSILFTLIIVLFLSLGIWFERIVIYITSFYRDYLPSSWSTYYDSNYFFEAIKSLLCFLIISGLVYWLLHKRKKLPFPSSILSYSLFFISYSLFTCIQVFN